MFNNGFFENIAVCEIWWSITVEPDRSQMTMRCKRIACWIPKATNTHSEYIKLIVFHCNNSCTNARQCYIIRTSPVLFMLHVSGLNFNPLNAELNPIRHLLALADAHHSVHVSRLRVKHAFSSVLISL